MSIFTFKFVFVVFRANITKNQLKTKVFKFLNELDLMAFDIPTSFSCDSEGIMHSVNKFIISSARLLCNHLRLCVRACVDL